MKSLYTADEAADLRAWAKQWAASALHFDGEMAVMIAQYIEEVPLQEAGMPYCGTCESMLCGACGSCHSIDTGWELNGWFCPADRDNKGSDCVAWEQAIKAIYEARRQYGMENDL